ncbi:MAG TPA: M20 family metallo-hydrolase [Candidatus Limnocylindrales bacterium]|nr:M20 family metallo-hydrolase [Candidatus Limnocylindrales bacterium]
MAQLTQLNGQLSVDGVRLRADLEALGRIGEVAGGGISRTSFSAADAQAREWYLERCAQAGLSVEVDGVGNMFVSAPADAHRHEPAVWSGSHIDTVPRGGRFDGAVGTVAALECVRRLHEAKVWLARPVRAVVYSDEEGNYSHLFGSSALVHGFTHAQLEALTGRDGDRFVDTFVAAGWDLDRATQTRLDPQAVHATVELHIEQGPQLEQRGDRIGVVTGIVGLGGATLTYRGRADHAGTTPMAMRRDALLAASALIVGLPDIARSVSDRAVVTVGVITVEPGGANVVPQTARLSVDFRDPDGERLAQLGRAITAAVGEVATRYGVQVDLDVAPVIAPCTLDERIQKIIAGAAAGRGLSASQLPSGAGHDSQNLATVAPTGMIFIPSTGGRSHCPQEHTTWQDIENGANVLLDTVTALAGR